MEGLGSGISLSGMSTLTKEEILQYNRQIKLSEIGLEGQEKLKKAKVLVVGAGGLGCPILLYLSSAGVGTIGVIDFDKVEIHNLHRQILFSVKDLGKQKATTAYHKLQQQNPNVHFKVYDERLNKFNISEIISQFDVVVDGSDNFSTRYMINDTCVSLNKTLVYGSILDFEGQFAVFNFKGSKNLRDIFPEPPNPKDIPGCDENGVLATLPAIIGSIMAQETLKILIGMPVYTNRLFIFDTKQLTLNNLSF